MVTAKVDKKGAMTATLDAGRTYEVNFSKVEVEGSIPQRFKKVYPLFSEKVALKSWEMSLSYGEFNRVTNRIARLILDQGESLELPVGFLFGNDAYPILSIFGILKAGGFYLPLDPSFPQYRLEFTLEDSGARILITSQENLELAHQITKGRLKTLTLDEIDPTIPDDDLDVHISPDAPVCLYYTSGSTGRPKGVVQIHRNVLHSAWVSVGQNRSTPDDRVALLHSVGFAASLLPIFGTLLTGGTLLPFDLKRGLANLANWLREEQITVFMGVPTLFRHLAQSLSGTEEFPSLRLITVGGEAVLKSDVELYKKYFSKFADMRHGIGGTEMGSFRYFMIDKETEIPENIVPVGYPVPDKEVLILDDDGYPVPPDEVGEIVVKSRYLSGGYWRRPDLTAAKFKDVPGEEGVRMYWTGDLGRLTEDGCLYHLGRKDFQVKIRGFRVELGEIESVLMQHPGISEAAVVVNERPGFEKRLIGYVVMDKRHPAPSTEEMRIYLKKHLPDYMVPSAFVTLEAMPQTATGKIDRLKLPKLEEVLNLEKDYVPPRDAYERRLIQIWEELFEMAPIGIRNDFFQLGGHSLLAASLVTRIEETFRKRIDLARLTEAPTIEKLAVVLRSVSELEARPILVPIRENGRKPPLFCVHGVGGHVLPFLLLAQYLGEDVPLYGLQSKGIQDRTEEDNTIEGMAAAYIKEIRTVQPAGPYFVAGFSFGGFVAYEMARQLNAAGQSVGLVAILDTHAGAAPHFLPSLNRVQRISYRTKSLLEKMRFQAQNLGQKSPKEIAAYLRHRQERPDVREAIMGDVEDEQVPDYMMAIIQANARALRTYRPGRYPGKVTLFRSLDHGKGVYYGWEELAAGGVEVFDVPGNHRGILQEPNVKFLAEKLSACL